MQGFAATLTLNWSRFHAELVALEAAATLNWSRFHAELVALFTLNWSRLYMIQKDSERFRTFFP
jgi:hypothetical protein